MVGRHILGRVMNTHASKRAVCVLVIAREAADGDAARGSLEHDGYITVGVDCMATAGALPRMLPSTP